MNIDYFNLGNGNVIYWGMEDYSIFKSTENQEFELKEDLIQVQYTNNTLLDVGWYPEFDFNAY